MLSASQLLIPVYFIIVPRNYFSLGSDIPRIDTMCVLTVPLSTVQIPEKLLLEVWQSPPQKDPKDSKDSKMWKH